MENTSTGDGKEVAVDPAEGLPILDPDDHEPLKLERPVAHEERRHHRHWEEDTFCAFVTPLLGFSGTDG